MWRHLRVARRIAPASGLSDLRKEIQPEWRNKLLPYRIFFRRILGPWIKISPLCASSNLLEPLRILHPSLKPFLFRQVFWSVHKRWQPESKVQDFRNLSQVLWRIVGSRIYPGRIRRLVSAKACPSTPKLWLMSLLTAKH